MMSLIAQNHFFIASKNNNSVFSANDEVAATDAQKLLPQRENVAKCNFKSKGSKT